MKKIISALISVLLFLNIGSILTFAEENGKTESYRIYVSANGNDEGDGSVSNPFATLKKAKEYVKTLDKSKGDIVIEIGDGTYYLDETLTFDETDSGTDNCTIRYVASDNANPVISGGRKIEGSWNDEGNGIYSISYNRDEKLRSLYVNGNRCFMTSNVAKAHGGVNKTVINEGQADWA